MPSITFTVSPADFLRLNAAATPVNLAPGIIPLYSDVRSWVIGTIITTVIQHEAQAANWAATNIVVPSPATPISLS